MRSLNQRRFIGVFYNSLPHWVVDKGRYAVTLRCAGTLPKAVRARLLEITDSLRKVDPVSAAAEQRRLKQFAILENCLDSGVGFAPFGRRDVAEAMTAFLETYRAANLSLVAWVIMPNHLHLLTEPMRCRTVEEFAVAWRRFKQSSAVAMNQACGRKGVFWQRHWYDRWVRNETEVARWLRYFEANPVKAGLAQEAGDYPFLHVPTGGCDAERLKSFSYGGAT